MLDFAIGAAGSPDPAAVNFVSQKVRRSSQAESASLVLEALAWEDLVPRRSEWADLASSAIEPNVFLEPAFAIPAAQHLGRSEGPLFLVVSGRGFGSEAPRMLALWPILQPKWGGLIRTWRHDLAASGVPLLAKQCAAEALALMVRWLANRWPNLPGFEIPLLPEEGPVALLLRAHCSQNALSFRGLGRRQRAILPNALHRAAGTPSSPPHRHRSLSRQWRRLSEQGKVNFVLHEGAGSIRTAAEQFLALEAGGWKGVRGSALLCDPKRATFTRTMTRLFARSGQCRISSLELQGVPIAMMISLRSGHEEFAWKIAYDQRLGAYSPGGQLIFDYTQILCGDAGIDRVDSCSDFDNPMIEKAWPDRLAISDVLVSLSPAKQAEFKAAAAKDALRRRLRERLKKAYRTAVKNRRG